MNLQELADKRGKKVYLYRLHDHTVEYSFEKLRCGEKLNGKHVIEVMGAYAPKSENEKEGG